MAIDRRDFLKATAAQAALVGVGDALGCQSSAANFVSQAP